MDPHVLIDGHSIPLDPGLSPSPSQQVRPYGKYFLLRKLAERGTAEFFLAKQVGPDGFDKNVVIKRMPPHLSPVDDFARRFKDEAKIAALLSHQNIVNTLDFGFAEDCLYICMEYLAGEDLSTILRTAQKRGQFVPLNVAARIVIEASNGLHYAHEVADEQGKSLNIVHREVSPLNIFVTYQGQVKLMDFCLVAGVVKGEHMYLAPEQAEGNKVLDRRVDVFSLGVCLYECLTNERPFSRDKDPAVLNAVMKGEFRWPRQVRPQLPRELEDVVLKAMALNPNDRYPTAADFGSDLRKYLGSTTSATGVDVIGQYVRSIVGPERFSAKSRIPSWAAMTRDGKALRTWSPPATASADGRENRSPHTATTVLRTPPAAVRKWRRFHIISVSLIAVSLAAAAVSAWQSKGTGVLPPIRVVGVETRPAVSRDAGPEAPAKPPVEP